MSTEDPLRFAMAALRVQDVFREELGEILKRRAVSRVVASGRTLITAEDMLAVIPETLAEAAKVMDGDDPLDYTRGT